MSQRQQTLLILRNQSNEAIADLICEAKGVEAVEIAMLVLRKSGGSGARRLEALMESWDEDGIDGAIKGLIGRFLDPR